MKLIIICCLLATLSGEVRARVFSRMQPPEPVTTANDTVQTSWLQQILDHNNTGSTTHWNQRYFVNTGAWKGGNSPVFLLVSGEEDASIYWTSGGAWVTWGYNYGALLFQLEHRYYGQSYPTPDASLENLQYLTSEQALGDISYFIQQMNTQYNLTSSNKWILFGGSYSGNLAAWARLKLPEQVYGSVASSAPLQATVDFYKYNDVIGKSLDTISPGCAAQVTAAVKSVQNMFTTSEGIQNVINEFDVCDGFDSNNTYDVVTFYQGLVGPIGTGVVSNNLGSSQATISFVCGIMNNDSIPEPVDRLAQLNNITSENGCIYAVYQANIASNQQTSWNNSALTGGNRQWAYQTCNEFGFFQTSETKSSLFSDTSPLNFFTQQCTDTFGSNYNANQINQSAYNTNQNYGGMDIKVDRVVFVQGSIDPWHALGMIKNPTAESPLILINGTTHCEDMLSPSNYDSQDLTNARNQIGTYLDKWLL